MTIPIIFLPLVFFSKFILSGYEMTSGIITPIFGSAYAAYALFVGYSLAAGVGALLWKYRKSPVEDKAKFVYLFIGFLLTSAIAFSTNILFADFIKNSAHYDLYSRLGLFSSIFVILFSGYAIAKHRLLNLKIIATELLSLGILVLSLLQTLSSDSVSALITNGVIFIILLVFIVMLVRSVENEVKRKEELQHLSDKLTLANEKLQELDKARAEFMSMASHQIQTPLTAIRGYVSLILEDPGKTLKSSYEDMLKKVMGSAERVIQLVEDYLNVSRIESGKMDFKFEKCSVEAICREVIDTLALRAKERNLSLKYEKPEEPLPEVIIDGPKIREVISNLVDNAIKYTPGGSVTVRIELRKRSETEDTDWIRITVFDTGIGIPQSDLPNLFGKFSRGKDKSRLKAAGTGLGLYIGKVMVENNGGRIWAESDGEGRGSRFIIEIPIVQKVDQLKTKWGGSM
jgi:signal transduction histidine kinase